MPVLKWGEVAYDDDFDRWWKYQRENPPRTLPPEPLPEPEPEPPKSYRGIMGPMPVITDRRRR